MTGLDVQTLPELQMLSTGLVATRARDKKDPSLMSSNLFRKWNTSFGRSELIKIDDGIDRLQSDRVVCYCRFHVVKRVPLLFSLFPDLVSPRYVIDRPHRFMNNNGADKWYSKKQKQNLSVQKLFCNNERPSDAMPGVHGKCQHVHTHTRLHSNYKLASDRVENESRTQVRTFRPPCPVRVAENLENKCCLKGSFYECLFASLRASMSIHGLVWSI